jgi:hypothetical protein
MYIFNLIFKNKNLSKKSFVDVVTPLNWKKWQQLLLLIK